MDPIGFTFEHFDAAGRWRDIDGGEPVDATGMLTGTDVDGPLDGVASLAARLASSAQVRDLHGDAVVPLRVRPRRAVDGDLCAVDKLAARSRDARRRRLQQDGARHRAHGRVPQPPAGGLAMSIDDPLLPRERSCAAPAARRSPCPGWRRWRARRAQRRDRAGQALHRDVLGQRHHPGGLDADAGAARPTSRCRRSWRRWQPHQADLVVIGGLEPAGRRRRRAPERHRRHADRAAAQLRAVRGRGRGPGGLADGPVGRSAHRRRRWRCRPSCARWSSACRSARPTTGGG